MWTARTPVSTLFTFWPPLPPLRKVSNRTSSQSYTACAASPQRLTSTNQFFRLCPGR